MPGLLNQKPRGGLLNTPTMIRQIQGPGMPGQGSPFAGMGGPGQGAGGNDPNAMALHYGGPGALLWRQIVHGMHDAKDPRAVLDVSKASKFYTDDTIGLLRPDFQKAYAKGKK